MSDGCEASRIDVETHLHPQRAIVKRETDPVHQTSDNSKYYDARNTPARRRDAFCSHTTPSAPVCLFEQAVKRELSRLLASLELG